MSSEHLKFFCTNHTPSKHNDEEEEGEETGKEEKEDEEDITDDYLLGTFLSISHIISFVTLQGLMR